MSNEAGNLECERCAHLRPRLGRCTPENRGHLQSQLLHAQREESIVQHISCGTEQGERANTGRMASNSAGSTNGADTARWPKLLSWLDNLLFKKNWQ
jgi:hypothetical protein